MPSFKNIAIPAAAGLGATALYDQLAYPKDYRPFDDYRRGLNTVFNMGLTTAGAALLRSGHGPGAMSAGLGMLVTPPIKDLALMAQKPLHDVSDTSKTLARNSTMGTAIGAGAVGLGGLALAKYMMSKAKEDAPRVKVTLPTKNPRDRETVVEMNINDKYLTPRTQERMYQQIRRQMREETRERALKRDPISGKLIPLPKWEQLYGDQGNQVTHDQALDHMKSATEYVIPSYNEMADIMEKWAGLAAAARTAATLTPGVSASALPKLDDPQAGSTPAGPAGPMSLQSGSPDEQANAVMQQEAIQGQLDDQGKQIQDAAKNEQALQAKINQSELEKKHLESTSQQQLEQLKTQHQSELAQIQSQADQQVQEAQREIAEAQHGAEIEKQKASLQIESNKMQNDIMSAAQTAQNPTGVSPALSSQLNGAISSISKLAALGIAFTKEPSVPTTKGASSPAPKPVVDKPQAPSLPGNSSSVTATPSPTQAQTPAPSPTPAVGQVPATQRNAQITNTIRPGVAAATLAQEKTVPTELSGKITQQQWDGMDSKTRMFQSKTREGQLRQGDLKSQASQLQADAASNPASQGMTMSEAGMRAAENGQSSSNYFGEGNGWLGRGLNSMGNGIADFLGGTNTYARAATNAVNAEGINNQLADNLGVSRGNNSWFGRMAGTLGDYAQMGSLGLQKGLRAISSPFSDANYSDIDEGWNKIQDRRSRVGQLDQARQAAGTDFNGYWDAFKGNVAGLSGAAQFAPGIGTFAASMAGGAMNPGARSFNPGAGYAVAGGGTPSPSPVPSAPMLAGAKPTGWTQTNYDPYGVSNSTSPWVQSLGLGKSAFHVTNVTGRTQELKKRVKWASQVPQVGPPAPVAPKMPKTPQPVPLQAAQVNGYMMPNQFRGAHTSATEFGSPMKNMIFNYGIPLADMGMKMFNLPGLLPQTRAPFRSQEMGMRVPRSNSELLAGMGIQ